MRECSIVEIEGLCCRHGRGRVICEHLRELEGFLMAQGAEVTFRGQAWSKNCREWVYFGCVLDLQKCRTAFHLPEFVVEHSHLGTHEGSERGLVCERCLDAVMGRHPDEPGSTSVACLP